MRKIEAIIRPEKLEDLREALDAIGCSSMTITEVKGRGHQKGIMLEWRVGEYRVEFLDKIKVEIVVEESKVKKIVDTITKTCATDSVGDGKIFILPVEEVIRIRTKENGKAAL